MIEGLVVMVVGVTVVFAFLVLLVLVMQTSAFFFTRVAKRVQEDVMIGKPERKAADLTEVAVAIAAVKAHVRNR